MNKVRSIALTISLLETVSFCWKEEGINLLDPEEAAAERMIVSQLLESEDKRFRCALMLRKARWKYIVYSGYEDRDILFDMENDPGETENVIARERDTADMFRRCAQDRFSFPAIEKEQKARRKITGWMAAWEKLAGEDDSERWKDIPESAKHHPVIRGGKI